MNKLLNLSFQTIFLYGSFLILAIASFLTSSTAMAYGQANWQATFSINCTNKSTCQVFDPVLQQLVPATFGTWGWCAFTGQTSGSAADCAYSGYAFSDDANVAGLVSTQVDGTAWSLGPPTNPVSVTSCPSDFYITQGTVTLNGPTIAAILKAGEGPILVSLECTINGSTVTCPIVNSHGVHVAQLFAPAFFEDQGYGPCAGHFTVHPLPGVNENIQITQIN